eukprot:m.234343 g.234343  ORF g.234343 m.234343 type:complete len:56 (+) comp26518_c0_seq9:1972-2139(+)
MMTRLYLVVAATPRQSALHGIAKEPQVVTINAVQSCDSEQPTPPFDSSPRELFAP